MTRDRQLLADEELYAVSGGEYCALYQYMWLYMEGKGILEMGYDCHGVPAATWTPAPHK